MPLLEKMNKIVKDVAAVAIAVAEVKKTCPIIADVAEAMVSTMQVQQAGLLVKFVVLLLYVEIRLAV